MMPASSGTAQGVLTAVSPFTAVRYDWSRMEDPASVLDDADRWEQVVTSASDEAAVQGLPYHVSQLYRDWVGSTVTAWLNEGRLVQDPPGCLYVYRCEGPAAPASRLPGGAPPSAAVTGLVAEVDVSAHASIRIAEQVDPAAVDRLAAAVKAFAFDLAPVWGLFSLAHAGSEAASAWQAVRAATDRPPLVQAREAEGTTHTLWRLEPGEAGPLAASFRGVSVAVVAGARRVAALRQAAARSSSANGAWGRALMVLAPFDEEKAAGPVLLPVHRLLLAEAGVQLDELERRVGFFFRLLPPGSGERPSLETVFQELGSMHPEFTGFAIYTGGGRYLLARSKGRMFMENWTHPLGRAAWRSMDVNVLHALVFERALGLAVTDSRLSRRPIALEPDATRALERVDRGDAVAAFLLPAPSPAQLYQAALDNNPLPAGAVSLWPAPRAGLIFRRRR